MFTDKYDALVRAYAQRACGGNVMDFEDACQDGQVLVYRALQAYNPAKGDEAQYVATRLAQLLEMGREAVKEPALFTDLANNEPDWDEAGDDLIDSLPAEADELDAQAADMAAYEEVLALKQMADDDPRKVLWRVWMARTVNVMGEDLPMDNPAVGRIVAQLQAIAAMPEGAPIRRMFVWLRLLDVQAPAVEDDSPTWVFEQAESPRLPGQPYTLFADDFMPSGVEVDERGKGPSWMLDGIAPDSTLPLEEPQECDRDDLARALKAGYDSLDEALNATLPVSWELAEGWQDGRELNEWLAGLGRPSKYSAASRRAFILAMTRGLGLKVASAAAWSAHRKTITGISPTGLVLGNGRVVAWSKADNSWARALDIEAAAACRFIRAKLAGNEPALRFAENLSRLQ